MKKSFEKASLQVCEWESFERACLQACRNGRR